VRAIKMGLAQFPSFEKSESKGTGAGGGVVVRPQRKEPWRIRGANHLRQNLHLGRGERVEGGRGLCYRKGAASGGRVGRE